jgi:hypothetical protein
MRITTVSQEHGLTSHEHHTSKGTGTRRSFLGASSLGTPVWHFLFISAQFLKR